MSVKVAKYSLYYHTSEPILASDHSLYPCTSVSSLSLDQYGIPDEIFICLRVRHFDIAQFGQKFTKTIPEWKNTCQTRDGHVSRVWDHHHWNPGEILTCLHVRHLDIAQNQMLVLFFPKFTSKTWSNTLTSPPRDSQKFRGHFCIPIWP